MSYWFCIFILNNILNYKFILNLCIRTLPFQRIVYSIHSKYWLLLKVKIKYITMYICNFTLDIELFGNHL